MMNVGDSIIQISVLLLLLISWAGAQSGWGSAPPDNYQYANFSPSMAIIIVVLIAALFFMGFFSIYIRHCSDTSSASATVRNLGASLRRRATPRGLDRAILETFPTFGYSEVKDRKIGKGTLECAVCLNEFEEDDTLRLIPKCDHVFHPECIDAWLDSHVTCPVCRANLAEPGEAQASDPEQPGEVSIRIAEEPEEEPAEPVTVPHQAVDMIESMNRTQLPRSRSVRTKVWQKFPRSHSTGHSPVRPGDNIDRFTLRLPEDLRKQVMTRALIRTTSCVVVLPMDSSSSKGYRTGFGEGSSKGGRSFKRVDPVAKSDRWVFSVAPPFFSRMPSMRLAKGGAADGEGSVSANTTPRRTMKLPSFKCLDPKGDEMCLFSEESSCQQYDNCIEPATCNKRH